MEKKDKISHEEALKDTLKIMLVVVFCVLTIIGFVLFISSLAPPII